MTVNSHTKLQIALSNRSNVHTFTRSHVDTFTRSHAHTLTLSHVHTFFSLDDMLI
jgi:hypothetical protein